MTASRHLGQQSLLSPSRCAGVEQWGSGFEKTEIVRGENPLPLIPVFQDVDAVLAGHRRSHEVARPLAKSPVAGGPPLFYLRDIWPRQTIIRVDVDVRIIGIICWARLKPFWFYRLQTVSDKVCTSDEGERFRCDSCGLLTGHVTNEPRHVRRVASDTAPLNQPAQVFRLASEDSKHAMGRAQT